MSLSSTLPPPSWPLDRQRALGADADPVSIWTTDPIWAEICRRKLRLEDPLAKYEYYWKRDELPPLYAVAVSFQNRAIILGIADVKVWIQAALDDLAAKGVYWVPHIQIVRAPTRDGKTFRVQYGIAGRTEGRLVSAIGITDDEALTYVAADYIEHRFTGDVISQPFTQRPHHWTLVLLEAGRVRSALHDDFIGRVF